jgi:hypothetical protein
MEESVVATAFHSSFPSARTGSFQLLALLAAASLFALSQALDLGTRPPARMGVPLIEDHAPAFRDAAPARRAAVMPHPRHAR